MAFFSMFLVMFGAVLVVLLMAVTLLLISLFFLLLWRRRRHQTNENGKRKGKPLLVFCFIFLILGVVLAAPPSIVIGGIGNAVFSYQLQSMGKLAGACQLPDFSTMGTAEEFSYNGQVFVAVDELQDPYYERLETVGHVQSERPDLFQIIPYFWEGNDNVLKIESVRNDGHLDLIYINGRIYCLKSEKDKVLEYYRKNASYWYYIEIVEGDHAGDGGIAPIADETYDKVLSASFPPNVSESCLVTESDRHFQIFRCSDDALYQGTVDILVTDTDVFLITGIENDTLAYYRLKEDLAWTVRHAVNSTIHE